MEHGDGTPPSLTHYIAHCSLFSLTAHFLPPIGSLTLPSLTGPALALQELSPTCRHLACFLPPNSGRVSCVSDNLSFDGQPGKRRPTFAYPVATNKMPSSHCLRDLCTFQRQMNGICSLQKAADKKQERRDEEEARDAASLPSTQFLIAMLI